MTGDLTDPSGPLFVSYRRARAPEIATILSALHDRGVPTWLDTKDLAAEPTGDELRRVLANPRTAAALMYLTPEVATSATIRDIEAPAIVRRHGASDGFWVQPVAAGGLDYTEAAETVAGKTGAEDLSRWNILRIDSDPASAPDATEIARSCLRRRLQALHANLPDGQPLAIRLHARGTASRHPGDALAVDWTHHFPDRTASSSSWATMAVASHDLAQAIRAYCPGRDVVATGTLGMPAAVLLGLAFPTRDGARLSWQQRQPDGTVSAPWAMAAAAGPEEAERAGWTSKLSSHDPSADACAVLINVSDDCTGAFGASRRSLPPWRAIVEISHPQKQVPLGDQEAASLVWLIVSGIRAARTELGPFASVHLFLAAPAGLAVLLGTLLATLPRVITYEYDTASTMYRRAVEIRP